MDTTEEHYLKKELYDLVKKDSAIFEFIQNGSLDGIWYWDIEKPENEWLSPRFWENFGYDPKTKRPLSSEWQTLINQDDLKVVTENFTKHCKDSTYPFDQVVRYRKNDGTTAWVRCRGLGIRDVNGKVIRCLGAHTDVTELKEKEIELQKKINELERLNKLMVGRELEMINLKKEIADLKNNK